VITIRVHFQTAASALLLLACASKGPTLPICPVLEMMQPPPGEQCLAEPEVGKFQEKLAAFLEDDKSPLLVRVEFDSQIAIGTICADRTSEQRQRLTRRRLAKQRPMISAMPPGPACLAGSRLDFNRAGQQIAVARRLLRKCERESDTVRRADESNPTSFAGERQASEVFLVCSNRQQRRLDQIWIFPELSLRGILYMFEATPEASPREAAIRVCSRERGSIVQRTGVAIGGDELNGCMRSQGWNPIE